jgi:hypothetical protein
VVRRDHVHPVRDVGIVRGDIQAGLR